MGNCDWHMKNGLYKARKETEKMAIKVIQIRECSHWDEINGSGRRRNESKALA